MISLLPACANSGQNSATRRVSSILRSCKSVQQACAAQPFCCGPKQYDCVGGPGYLAFRIAKSALQFQDRFSVLPNGYRRAEFTKAREVFLEKRSQAIAKSFCGKLHQRASTSVSDQGGALSKPPTF